MYTPIGLTAYYFFYPGFIMLSFMWINNVTTKKTMSRMSSLYLNIVQALFLTMNSKQNSKFSKIIASKFSLFFVFNKLWNLVPLKTSISANMLFTLLFAILIWLAFNSSSLFFNLFKYFARFTTPGSPSLLVPFIKVVKVITIVIRPVNMGVRLAMKLMVGRLLMSSFTYAHCSFLMKVSFSFFILIFFGLFIFSYAFFMCIFRALVYNLTLNQYIDEHSS